MLLSDFFMYLWLSVESFWTRSNKVCHCNLSLKNTKRKLVFLLVFSSLIRTFARDYILMRVIRL